MNKQEKKQYFGNYYYQKVGCIIGHNLLSDLIIDEDYINEVDYIELRPLSSITDEEYIYISSLIFNGVLFPDMGKYALWFHFEWGENTNMVSPNDRKEIEIISAFTLIQITDYLKKQSIATPWREYTVEKLISEGVLKLKEV